MHSDVSGAPMLQPTVHISLPLPLPREHVDPPLTVARVVSAPKIVSVRFRRQRFGDCEFLEIKDPQVMQNFVGLQLMVLNETIGESYGVELPEVLTKHNGEGNNFVSAMAVAAGMDEAAMVSALVDHNQVSVVFVPKSCTVTFTIAAAKPA